ncbi:MAG: pyrroline-5-carboxylate reductase [Solobacterium sp.]|nr:pyrroline-5-carboxylate reductase [Solobacterium sp.]
MSKEYTIGFIGCGHMGMAIARGAAKAGYVESGKIGVFDPSERIQEISRSEGFGILESEKEVIRRSEIVLLCVTPQIVDTVLENMKGEKIDTLVSIVTGVSMRYMQDRLDNAPVIRLMPNTPLQVGTGASVICRSDNCSDEAYDFVIRLFDSMGITKEVPEEQMNIGVALHGSTPAYAYYFMQCLIKDAEKRGVDSQTARELIVQTFKGSCELLQANPDKPLDDFINEVCSKGGTTIEAVTELKNRGTEGIIHDANEKCIRRAAEIGR